MKFKVYSSKMIAPDGCAYSIRYLRDPDERAGLQSAGLVMDNCCEVIGMQDAADLIAADFEVQAETASGRRLQ
mgnify:FL=1